ncbi:MAG: beta-eliminating lyase-related protein [Defluviitaleaceae bacterium]|nr:beta-eliminating lyase-related protein [Defluviitaleaceae bacterium]
MPQIDLRSDTVTKPTPEMRHAMATCEVGDDVYSDDPTVTRLEKLAARTMGKEAALFVPTGTMGNQLSIMVHVKPTDEIILGRNSHVVAYEVGAVALLSGANYALVDHPDDYVTAEHIHNYVRSKNIHFPDTGLVCVENALCNGLVVPLDVMKATYEAAKSYSIPVHMDGARIFNAALYLGVDVKELAACCDTVTFCLSKGLAAPVGSLICGDAKFIAKARKMRKLLGAGMRQAGVLAAPGIIAIDKMTQRLQEDHNNALQLAAKLGEIDNVEIPVQPQINMVFFKIVREGFNHAAFTAGLLERGIKSNPIRGAGVYRFVTHNDFKADDIPYVVDNVRQLVAAK